MSVGIDMYFCNLNMHLFYSRGQLGQGGLDSSEVPSRIEALGGLGVVQVSIQY